MLKSTLGAAFGAATLLLTVTGIPVLPLAILGSAMADEVSALFSQGLQDRTGSENWVASLNGEERAGAEYWLRQRSLPNPGNCLGTPDFAKGCNEAKARLTRPDALRNSQPEYRRGWYAYVATATPAPVQPSSALFSQGLVDRTGWDNWLSSLNGDERAGAIYWASQRSLPNPGSCLGTPDFVKGCYEAKARLTGPDTLRRSQPAYRQGWNSSVAIATLAPVLPSLSPVPVQPLPDTTQQQIDAAKLEKAKAEAEKAKAEAEKAKAEAEKAKAEAEKAKAEAETTRANTQNASPQLAAPPQSTTLAVPPAPASGVRSVGQSAGHVAEQSSEGVKTPAPPVGAGSATDCCATADDVMNEARNFGVDKTTAAYLGAFAGFDEALHESPWKATLVELMIGKNKLRPPLRNPVLHCYRQHFPKKRLKPLNYPIRRISINA